MYIFLDIDGTLIDYNMKLPHSARYAVNEARKNGHKVLYCTGCSTIEIDIRHYDLAIDGFIGGNGCYIEYEGKVIRHQSLTREQCNHFTKWCEDRDLAYRLECNSGMYISDGYEEKSLEARRKYSGVDNPPMNPCMVAGGNLDRDDVNKTAFVLKSYQDYIDALNEFPDMVVGHWGGVGELALYGDTSPIGVNKGDSILYLLDYLGEDNDDTIGFGDAMSDLPMFEVCKHKVAMGNAGDIVKEAATYVTGAVDDYGLYDAFVHFGLIEDTFVKTK